MAAVAAAGSIDNPDDDGRKAAIVAGLAAVPGTSALYGTIVIPICRDKIPRDQPRPVAPAIAPRERARTAPLSPERQRRRELAMQMTNAARESAARGDCPSARELEQRVRAVDVEYHTRVFVVDAVIRECVVPADSP